MGMSLRPLDESVPASEGLEHSVIADKVLRAAADQRHQVCLQRLPGEGHQGHGHVPGCLAHPRQEVCPKHAISFRNGKSHIDQSLCVKCGRCVNSCPLQRHRQDRASLRRRLRHGRDPL